jgi:flagellar L-ring protein precursor FlgH
MNWKCVLVLLVIASPAVHAGKKKLFAAEPSPLDQYLEAAHQHAMAAPGGIAGSLYIPGAQFEYLAADLRAGRVDDIVTIVVSEQASAVATGTVKTARNSSAQSAVTAAGGITRAAGPFANLAKTNTQTALDGQGTTTRTSTITTTVAARVTEVLPNGYLVIEGAKVVQVNSENQRITVRGVIRPVDLQPNNSIPSNQIGQLEVRVNGKGVVNDAVRRPFFLYRLLLGLLPF